VTPRKSVLVVSSSGGVLLELLALRPWLSRHDVSWAVVRAADTESVLRPYRTHWISDLSLRNPLRLAPAALRALRIVSTERPGLIVSAGSGPAVPYFVIAALLDIPTFWLSTHNVLTRPGIAARICAALSARVLLQRPEQLAGHPEGIVIGELY
jgi:UDP-N-acetylglucosamine:LPS N-acetylglucosamine transferase